MANCPKCASNINPGSRFCVHCGYNMEQHNTGQMTCPTCKTRYPSNIFFCPKDGSRLQIQVENPLRCSICGQTYPENTNFCPADGGRLTLQAPQSERLTVAVTYATNTGRITYPKADFGDRILASILDTIFILLLGALAIYLFVTGVLQSIMDTEAGIGKILLSLVACLFPIGYSLVLDGLGKGQSWGKAALKLMVVNLDNNQPCSFGKSVVRNLVSWLVD
jgi:hypothetical protein